MRNLNIKNMVYFFKQDFNRTLIKKDLTYSALIVIIFLINTFSIK